MRTLQKNLHLLKRTEDMEKGGLKCKPGILHLCLCDVSKTGDHAPRPAVSTALDAWDNDHVKLPYSPQNIHTENGTPVKLWNIIQQALSGSLESAEEFEKAVLSYNADYAPGIWNVDILSAALQHRPDFRPLLKKIADLALKLPDLITRPIPLMKQNRESSISLSQIQVACLLANAFYCTFPGRSGSNARHQQPTFPSVNFNTLFWACSSRGSGLEKVICILHYFSRVLGEDGPTTGTVTFSRRCLNNPPDFQSSEVLIGSIPFGTSSTCRIEDAGSQTMQVDFADPLIGGEFLRFGNVQEEIMCCMQPEILAGRLFLERLLSHEAALVIGAERFCNYTGYGRSFQWVGNFKEADHGSSRDSRGQWKKVIVVIDASRFRNCSSQFQESHIRRELNKAFIGFTDRAAPYQPLPSIVVSGNWGCGVFRGNKALKALIQLMACAQAGKALAYSTFENESLEKELQRLHSSLVASNCSVGRLWSILTRLQPPERLNEDKRTAYVFEHVNEALSKPPTF
uniref:poly(ADP-ribose) glycohydrolase n=1 Tax=Schistocephalus solidus TaxID=70667 RepID=A0A0X3Q3N1_SCHSO